MDDRDLDGVGGGAALPEDKEEVTGGGDRGAGACVVGTLAGWPPAVPGGAAWRGTCVHVCPGAAPDSEPVVLPWVGVEPALAVPAAGGGRGAPGSGPQGPPAGWGRCAGPWALELAAGPPPAPCASLAATPSA